MWIVSFRENAMGPASLTAVILLKVIGTFDSFFITLVFCIDACVLSAM